MGLGNKVPVSSTADMAVAKLLEACIPSEAPAAAAVVDGPVPYNGGLHDDMEVSSATPASLAVAGAVFCIAVGLPSCSQAPTVTETAVPYTAAPSPPAACVSAAAAAVVEKATSGLHRSLEKPSRQSITTLTR